jgi:hypothetical protein
MYVNLYVSNMIITYTILYVNSIVAPVFVALQQGIVGGYPDGAFKPENGTTRAEACAMIGNFLSAHK